MSSASLTCSQTLARLTSSNPGRFWSSYGYSAALAFLDTGHAQTRLGGCHKVLNFVHQLLLWLRVILNWASENIGDPFSSNQSLATPLSTSCPLPGLHFENDTGFLVEIIRDHPVGLGGYSDVWKGEMASFEGSEITLVAIKFLRQFGGKSSPERILKRLKREVRVWKLLDHESIAGFYGVTYNSKGMPAIISPWYPNGSADVFLQQHPDANPVKLIWEIVSGVEYLHENNVVHGDLKGGNVMIDDMGHAKLIDFGLSRIIDSESGFTMSGVAVSIRWCPPELILTDNAQVTKSSDVYAWASTALELLTGDVPYSSQRELTVLLTVINKVAPRKPTNPLRYSIGNVGELWKLLEECWTEAPRHPSIAEVKHRMRPFYH